MHSCVNGGGSDTESMEGKTVTIQWCKVTNSPAYYAVIILPTVVAGGVITWRVRAAAQRRRAMMAANANAALNAPLLDGAARGV